VAKGSLGPFPKTRRWREIVAYAQPALWEPDVEMLADLLLCRLKSKLEFLEKDPEALKAVVFWVALPIATRAADPFRELKDSFGIHLTGPSLPELTDALDQFAPADSAAKRAASATISGVDADEALLPTGQWAKWRAFDGSDFCNLAYRFFTHLSEELYSELVREAHPEHIAIFAKESAIITRAFSARWFNACARDKSPSSGSIRWYWGHCLGKLDLEASREMSDWVEPPKRRKGPEHPTLEL
jgi:hypothetical protein